MEWGSNLQELAVSAVGIGLRPVDLLYVLLEWDFSVVGFHSPSLMLLFFFSCFLWYRCVELVFWCFGLFYSELCGSSLAWAPCMWLFCLWGDSYLLAGGCALCMCFPASWWLWSGDYSFSILFWCFGLVLDRVHLCFRLLLSKCYYSILFFFVIVEI